MKKLNLSLLAILITVSLMPQSAFSMEQPQGNPTTPSQQDSIVYTSAITRIFNGQSQRLNKYGTPKADGTVTYDYRWENFNRIAEPCQYGPAPTIVRYTQEPQAETYNR